jgi:hypothetical protein
LEYQNKIYHHIRAYCFFFSFILFIDENRKIFCEDSHLNLIRKERCFLVSPKGTGLAIAMGSRNHLGDLWWYAVEANRKSAPAAPFFLLSC